MPQACPVLPPGPSPKENQSTLEKNARHGLRTGTEVLPGTGEEGTVKSNGIIMTLLALAFSKSPGPAAGRRLSARRKLYGDDPAERGNVKTWVIVALLSAALIAVLLAISGPVLVALLSEVMDRFG